MADLDEAFHSPARLQVAAFLSGCDEAAFTAAQSRLDMDKGTLSKSIRHLEDAGYAVVRKGYHGRLPRTWMALTQIGRQALADHLEALQELAARARAAPVSAGTTPRAAS